MDKRTFIRTAAIAGAGVIITRTGNISASSDNLVASGNDQANFQQIKLPYGYDALEPYIDAKTIEIHYSKHYATYTKNFVAALQEQQITATDIKDIFAKVSTCPVKLRNQGGGYYNHNLYFNIMAPNAGGEPTGELAKRINTDFGSFANFRDEFTKCGTSQFGSGWAWLIVKDHKLQIINSGNQDNPLMDISAVRGIPILNMDVWEHSYYLKYQNRRAEYITAFWNVINWKQVETNFLSSGQ